MTLVDSTVFLYAAAREQPRKKRALAFLEKAAVGSIEAVVDAEVLRELLDGYRVLQCWKEGQTVYDTARILFPEVLPVTGEVMDQAHRLMEGHQGLTSSKALHAAIVDVYGLESITSFDQAWDRVPGLRRVEP